MGTNSCVISKTPACPSSTVPKMSYAQIAQKPNKSSPFTKDIFENGDEEFAELPSTSAVDTVVKSTPDVTCSKTTTESVVDTNSSCAAAKVQRKSSKGAPPTTDSCETVEENVTIPPHADKPAPPVDIPLATTAATTVTTSECQSTVGSPVAP